MFSQNFSQIYYKIFIRNKNKLFCKTIANILDMIFNHIAWPKLGLILIPNILAELFVTFLIKFSNYHLKNKIIKILAKNVWPDFGSNFKVIAGLPFKLNFSMTVVVLEFGRNQTKRLNFYLYKIKLNCFSTSYQHSCRM